MAEIGEIIEEAVHEHVHGGEASGHSLNSKVGVAVAITATVMALMNIRSQDVVQDMALTSSEVNNAWAYFQSKSLKQHLAENSRALLESGATVAGAAGAQLQPTIDRYASEVVRYDNEKKEIQRKAEELERERAHLQAQNARFGASEAAFSLSLALFGLTALTQRRALLALGIVFALVGLGAGLSAEFSWKLPVPHAATHES